MVGRGKDIEMFEVNDCEYIVIRKKEEEFRLGERQSEVATGQTSVPQTPR